MTNEKHGFLASDLCVGKHTSLGMQAYGKHDTRGHI